MRAALRQMLAFTVAVLVAGCLGTGPKDSQKPTNAGYVLQEIPAIPLEQEHDHSNPALHNLTINFAMVGHHSGYGDGATSAIPAGEGFSELFVRNGLAFLGRRGGNDGGFVIVDVKDPAHPKALSAYQGLANYDMESTYDNRYVFFVSQYFNNQQTASVPPRGTGDAPRGIHVIDITDPSKPSEISAAFTPAPTRGAHTITYYRTEAGRELVAAQSYDFLPDPSFGLPVAGAGSNPVSQRVLLFDFLRTPQPHLQLLSTYEQHPTSQPVGTYFPHDVSIQKHPVTGKLLMYVAYWNLGGFIVDITDPTKPATIASLTDFSPSKLFDIHLVAPADGLIDGMAIAVTEPELGGGEKETGQYTIFDTTNPAKPVRLGYWTLPGNMTNPTEGGLRFSPHNFEIRDGNLLLAHYHGGVWLVDIHNETLLNHPKTLAMAQPNLPRPGYKGDIPNDWSAVFDQNGRVYVSDIATGLYVYKYLGDPESDPCDGSATACAQVSGQK